MRHEEMAAFMACAHAKFTGEVGVCLATSGPGAIHPPERPVRREARPPAVVAIVGQTATPALGGSYQQEVDLTTLFKDVAHEYVELASSPEQMRHLVDRAVRIAKAERTVTCLIIPNDVGGMDAVETPARAHATIHSSVGYSPPTIVPTEADLKRAAEALNAGEQAAMLVGAGGARRHRRGGAGRGAARLTGFLHVAALCRARSLQLSAHCGPSIHVHPLLRGRAAAPPRVLPRPRRIEQMLFDGVLVPVPGELRPDLSRPGNGLELKRAHAERYAI